MAETFSLEEQEAEERSDLALVAALEIDVTPYLGDLRVPDYIIIQLARVLQQGSRIREGAEYRPPSPASPGIKAPKSSYEFDKITEYNGTSDGATESGKILARERFSYWCFDLLFLICSDVAQGINLTSLYADLLLTSIC